MKLSFHSAAESDPRKLAEIALAATGDASGAPFGSESSDNAAILRERFTARAINTATAWKTIDAMVKYADDPHTWHFDKRQAAAIDAANDGKPYSSLGVVLAKQPDGRFAITEVHAASPAASSHLVPGDVVLAIAGRPVAHAYDVMHTWGTPNGKTVKVSVLSKDAAAPRDVDVTLATYAPPLLQTRVIKGGVGVVRMFYAARSKDTARNVVDLLRTAFADLEGQKVKSIVLDFRGTFFGDAAVALASLLTDATVMMQTRWGRRSGGEESVPRSGGYALLKASLAVLVDEGTMSTAEIAAFVAARFNKALIVGQPTAGALTTIEVLELGDGHVLLFPKRFILDATNRTLPDLRRLAPDRVVPNRTAEQIAAGVDPQLDTAVAALAARRGDRKQGE